MPTNSVKYLVKFADKLVNLLQITLFVPYMGKLSRREDLNETIFVNIF